MTDYELYRIVAEDSLYTALGILGMVILLVIAYMIIDRDSERR